MLKTKKQQNFRLQKPVFRRQSIKQQQQKKFTTIQTLTIDRNADLTLKKILSKEENKIKDTTQISPEEILDSTPLKVIAERILESQIKQAIDDKKTEEKSEQTNETIITDENNEQQQQEKNENSMENSEHWESEGESLDGDESTQSNSPVEEMVLQRQDSKVTPEQQKLRDQEKYNLVFKHSYSEIYQIKEIGGVILNQKRFYRKNDDKYKLRENKTYKYILPQKTCKAQKSIVLDMDETLLYSFPEVYTTQNNFYYKTVIRPHLLEFLRELKQHYELILFTAAEEDYSRRILIGFGILDIFDHVLFRQHMAQTDYESIDEDGDVRKIFTKDLIPLNRALKNVCIVDDKRQRFERQPNNGIEINKWYGRNKEDNSLLILKTFFLHVAKNPNTYNNFNFAKGEYKGLSLNFKKMKDWYYKQQQNDSNQPKLQRQQTIEPEDIPVQCNHKSQPEYQYLRQQQLYDNQKTNNQNENQIQNRQESEITDSAAQQQGESQTLATDKELDIENI